MVRTSKKMMECEERATIEGVSIAQERLEGTALKCFNKSICKMPTRLHEWEATPKFKSGHYVNARPNQYSEMAWRLRTHSPNRNSKPSPERGYSGF
jgi:hypothetical protein